MSALWNGSFTCTVFGKARHGTAERHASPAVLHGVGSVRKSLNTSVVSLSDVVHSRMPARGARGKKVKLVGVKVDAKSHTSAPAADRHSQSSAGEISSVTEAASRPCGVAPSGAGAEVTRPVTASKSAGKPAKLPGPPPPGPPPGPPPLLPLLAVDLSAKLTWCAVEQMPRQSWLRRRRKHWPDQSRSTVFSRDTWRFSEMNAEPRCQWVVPKSRHHNERRHRFPGRSITNASVHRYRRRETETVISTRRQHT